MGRDSQGVETAMLNWSAIWNRVFKLIDVPGDSYHSGSRFIKAVQEVDPYFPNYGEYIEQRRKADQSTTRRDFYKDIFLGLDEPGRFKLVSNILNAVEASDPNFCSEIRTMMAGGVLAPSVTVPEYAWNSDRLNEYLKGMDGAIAAGEYERTVTMAYTCLEGFLGAFIRAKSPRAAYPNEIVDLSKEVSDYLKSINKDYPGEVLNLIKHSAHAVDRARNRFSEAHFGGEAGLWLAIYMRDLVNTQIRLLLHFM
jgi:hypothetical protein